MIHYLKKEMFTTILKNVNKKRRICGYTLGELMLVYIFEMQSKPKS